MTAKLEAAFKKAAELSPELQDMIAEQILADIEDEQRWDQTFATSQDALKILAERALRNRKEGKTIEMGWDEL
jgi:hypothetical protein